MVEVLEKEKGNAEMVKLALETLAALIGDDDEGEQDDGGLGQGFSEVRRRGGVDLVRRAG